MSGLTKNRTNKQIETLTGIFYKGSTEMGLAKTGNNNWIEPLSGDTLSGFAYTITVLSGRKGECCSPHPQHHQHCPLTSFLPLSLFSSRANAACRHNTKRGHIYVPLNYFCEVRRIDNKKRWNCMNFGQKNTVKRGEGRTPCRWGGYGGTWFRASCRGGSYVKVREANENTTALRVLSDRSRGTGKFTLRPRMHCGSITFRSSSRT